MEGKKLKVIMIDAFKPKYLKYAPYLSSLCEKYQHGELEMPLGHWGGEDVVFNGKSDKITLFVKAEHSSLKFVRYLTWLRYLGGFGRFVIDSMINLPRFLKGNVLFRTGNVPLNRLWKFDFCVKRPVSSHLNIERFYFGEADKIGHRYGTRSFELIKTIRKIDEELSKMDWDIIFSDHGMADIQKIISVPITKDCFIDSDMARYWGTKGELERMKKRLPIGDGKIIKSPNTESGELIFLANTGILILPNFWQGDKKVKAMHGYDGKHKDMKAFYIVRKTGNKRDLKAEELHKILIYMKDGR